MGRRYRDPMTVQERFDRHVADGPGGCRLWVGARNLVGRGVMNIDNKTVQANRMAYEEFYGDGSIPEKKVLQQSCGRQNCITPSHQMIVTASDVALARGPKGRRPTCAHGHPTTPENTHVAPNGKLSCRVCIAKRAKRAHCQRA